MDEQKLQAYLYDGELQLDPLYEAYSNGRKTALEEILHKLPELVEVHNDVQIIDDRQIGMERITYRGYDVAYIKFDPEDFVFSIAAIDRDRLKNMIEEAHNG